MRNLKILSLFVLLQILLPLHAFSTKIQVRGINYKIETNTRTAFVDDNTGSNISGDIEIPSDIVYDRNIYTVVRISKYAFEGCRRITGITLPNTMTSIGKKAFYKCPALARITFSNSITSIEESAFYECSKLTGITLPESLTVIEDSTFYGCSGLTSIRLSNSLTAIGEGAFSYCSSLLEILIPNSVVSIGNSVFERCTDLHSITFSESLTHIGERAFSGCYDLRNITLPNSVVSVGNSAFSYCSNLVNITLSNSLARIEDDTFFKCYALRNITLPNSVTRIGESSFGYCSGLTAVTIQNSTSIGDYAFSYCSNLTSISLPNSLISIGERAFLECLKLPGILLPNSLTSIGVGAFYNCAKLMDITLPNSLTSIGSIIFSGCPKITNITVPNSVTYIDDFAFSGCINLKSMTIGSSLNTIGDKSLNGCTSLEQLHCLAIDPVIVSAEVLESINTTTCTLYVPIGSKAKYETFIYWREFTNIVEEKLEGQEITYSIGAYHNEGGTVSLNGQPVSNSFVNIREKEKVTIAMTADEGYEIHKVTLGDNEITSSVKDGKYEIESLTGNISLFIEFKETPICLTLSYADCGNMFIVVPKGTVYNIGLRAAEGWCINTVTFNDIDVTGQVDCNLLYTTPEIDQNSTLRVSFENTDTPIFETTSDSISVFNQNSDIVIKGAAAGTFVNIYTETGAAIASARAQGDNLRIHVQHGIYIVKVGNRTFKVAV